MIGQGYGLTETSAVIPVPDRAGMLPGSLGRLAPGTELRLLDPDTGRDARPGEPGELCVRGPQVMAGYLAVPRPPRRCSAPAAVCCRAPDTPLLRKPYCMDASFMLF
jgi:acyl-CoA synthetase (AMP-forming)/AMP-acid ligase II